MLINCNKIIYLLVFPPFSLSADTQVNGFEVHDPEEAILLFLEQDQDITLTVARPLKVSQTGDGEVPVQ